MKSHLSLIEVTAFRNFQNYFCEKQWQKVASAEDEEKAKGLCAVSGNVQRMGKLEIPQKKFKEGLLSGQVIHLRNIA